MNFFVDNVVVIFSQANYVVKNTPNQPLNESAGFRRALQLLSSGLLLKGSSGMMFLPYAHVYSIA